MNVRCGGGKDGAVGARAWHDEQGGDRQRRLRPQSRRMLGGAWFKEELKSLLFDRQAFEMSARLRENGAWPRRALEIYIFVQDGSASKVIVKLTSPASGCGGVALSGSPRTILKTTELPALSSMPLFHFERNVTLSIESIMGFNSLVIE